MAGRGLREPALTPSEAAGPRPPPSNAPAACLVPSSPPNELPNALLPEPAAAADDDASSDVKVGARRGLSGAPPAPPPAKGLLPEAAAGDVTGVPRPNPEVAVPPPAADPPPVLPAAPPSAAVARIRRLPPGPLAGDALVLSRLPSRSNGSDRPPRGVPARPPTPSPAWASG